MLSSSRYVTIEFNGKDITPALFKIVGPYQAGGEASVVPNPPISKSRRICPRAIDGWP